MYTLVTGDDALVTQTLKIAGVAFDVSGLTIKSRVISKDRRSALTSEITNSSGGTGADWVNGIVAIVIPGSETEDIDPVSHPEVWIETQVNDGTYDKTWFTLVEVVKGNIA